MLRKAGKPLQRFPGLPSALPQKRRHTPAIPDRSGALKRWLPCIHCDRCGPVSGRQNHSFLCNKMHIQLRSKLFRAGCRLWLPRIKKPRQRPVITSHVAIAVVRSSAAVRTQGLSRTRGRRRDGRFPGLQVVAGKAAFPGCIPVASCFSGSPLTVAGTAADYAYSFGLAYRIPS